jgi:hypothetical protein
VPQKRQAVVLDFPICSASEAPHDGHLNASPDIPFLSSPSSAGPFPLIADMMLQTDTLPV